MTAAESMRMHTCLQHGRAWWRAHVGGVGVCLALIMLLFCSAPAIGGVVLLDKPSIALHPEIMVFVDSTRQLGLDDIRTEAIDSQFQPFNEAPGEYGGVNVWMKFTLLPRVSEEKEWWLEIRPASLENLTLYQPHLDGTVTTSFSGRKTSYDLLEVNYRYPLFKLDIEGVQAQSFYLKVESDMYGINSIYLWEPAAFVGGTTGSIFLWGMYLGIFSLLSIASFWFEKAVKDGVYRAFGMYTFGCILMTLGATGLFFQYQRWLGLPAGTIPFVAWSILFGVYSCVNFFFRFIGMQVIKPTLTRWFLGTVKYTALVIGVLLLIPSVSLKARVLMAFLIVFVLAPVTILTLWRPALKSGSEVRYAFFVTGLLLACSIIVQYFIHRGYINMPGSGDYVTGMTSLAFALVIYYSISKRYASMRIAKESAQSDILDMMHRSERELDRQVQDKKRDLIAAMETINRALAQERAAYEEQKNFIERVSTEIHAPLGIIDQTTKDMVRQASEMSPKMYMRLEKIQQSTTRLAVLMNDYLASNRLHRVERVVNSSMLVLPALLNDAVAAARPLAELHIFTVESDAKSQCIYADPDLLRLVLRTLVDNAVNYTAPGTRITLRAQTMDDGWAIDVIDVGSGVAHDECAFIFDRYFRGRTAATRTGTGLGLPLARNLIEMQGGKLTLLDTEQGCTFRIYLPVPDKRTRLYDEEAA